MKFKTKLKECKGTVKADFPETPSVVQVQCSCGKIVELRFSAGVWGGLYVSEAKHVKEN